MHVFDKKTLTRFNNIAIQATVQLAVEKGVVVFIESPDVSI